MTTATTPATTAPGPLEDALRGVRALILDADGVIVLKGEPIPGAVDALNRLHERGIPYRIVTNNSINHRRTLAERMLAIGVPMRPEQITTAASATAAHTAARHRGRPIAVLASADALGEFEGQTLVPIDEANGRSDVAAVVVGDAQEQLSFANLDIVFRLVRGGAEFLAMHRNPWWLTPRGPTLDSGAIVAGLEFATGRRATIVGKPSPGVFRAALAELAAQGGVGRLPRTSVAMVGDDLRADLAPARRLGLRGILVLTGKHGREDVERAAARSPRRGAADGIADSLRDVVAALP